MPVEQLQIATRLLYSLKTLARCQLTNSVLGRFAGLPGAKSRPGLIDHRVHSLHIVALS